MNNNPIFLTATGTDAGKTFICVKLIQLLQRNFYNCFAIKPVISGFIDNSEDSDTVKILKVLNLEIKPENLDKISPWRFKLPLSPNIAALYENRKISFEQIINFCKEAADTHENLLIETAGGIMTPINDTHSWIDLIKELNYSTILISSIYLGCITHLLTSIETCKYHNIDIKYIILNNALNSDLNSQDIINSLKQFTSYEIIFLDYNAAMLSDELLSRF